MYESRAELETLHGRKKVSTRYQEGAKRVVSHYKDRPGFKRLDIVFCLTGGIYPTVDLTRSIARLKPAFPVAIHPFVASRYGDKQHGDATVQLHEVPGRGIPSNADILLVDDILDQGLTLQACVEMIRRERNPRSVHCYVHSIRQGCTIPEGVELLCKPLELTGDLWGVGHGMSDSEGYLRGLDEIATIPILA